MGSLGPRGGVGIFFLAPPRWWGYPRGHILLVPLRGSIWSVIWLDLLVPSGARARVPRAPFLGPSRAQLFLFCLVLSRTRTSWSFGARLSWSLGASFSWSFRGLDFLAHQGLVFLLLAGGSIPFWSLEGPIFLGPFRGSIFFGPLEGSIFVVLSRARFFWSFRGLGSFWSFRGLDSFWSFRGLDSFWSFRGLDSVWPSRGLDFFWSFRGLDFLVLSRARFFGPFSRGLDFRGPFEGSIFFWSFQGPDFFFGSSRGLDFLLGIHCLVPSEHVYYRHRPMVRALGGLVSLGLSVLSPFRVSGLSILICVQAHCSCFFRHRCG